MRIWCPLCRKTQKLFSSLPWAEVLPALCLFCCIWLSNLQVHGCAQQDLAGDCLSLYIPTALVLPDAQALFLRDRGNLPVPSAILSFSFMCLEHIKNRFFLFIAVHDVPKGKKIKLKISLIFQRSLLFPGSSMELQGAVSPTQENVYTISPLDRDSSSEVPGL